MGENWNRPRYERILFVPYCNLTSLEIYKPYFMVEMESLGGYINCQQYEEENYKIAGFGIQAFNELYLERRGFLNINYPDLCLQRMKLKKGMISKIKDTYNSKNKKKAVYFFKEQSDVLDKKR